MAIRVHAQWLSAIIPSVTISGQSCGFVTYWFKHEIKQARKIKENYLILDQTGDKIWVSIINMT